MGYWDKPGASDEWYTPPHIFQALGCRFDLDPANAAIGGAHVPCAMNYSADGLDKPWHGFVWLNPPFGGRNGIVPWLNKFFEHGNGIALTPDRTSAPWFWDAWHKAELALFTRKIRFIRPDGSEGKSPSNGTALFAVGHEGCEALRRAFAAGLGILATPTPGGSND
ncbi:N-6-adenine-methyltransferase [Agaricicola taiwanensis]|uniref:N-6-adenine-methyltransferase n=1 Tax=Agaricicola taiwanensis TaxID=591372 RepID=A0A8J2VQ57_9RHOB|nr:DNA N-6-adenine-methyltransferase [Agaricicola taiwanensis]GGE36557.1 N-6-adenine-methyltransferase [Agaricicola taiwanensis]